MHGGVLARDRSHRQTLLSCNHGSACRVRMPATLLEPLLHLKLMLLDLMLCETDTPCELPSAPITDEPLPVVVSRPGELVVTPSQNVKNAFALGAKGVNQIGPILRNTATNFVAMKG